MTKPAMGMSARQLEAFCGRWPGVTCDIKWGADLVLSVGGKMFAMVRLEQDESLERDEKRRVISYSAGPERYHELLEREGIFPAPYAARIFYVAVRSWDVFRKAEWEQELSSAHALTYAKLPEKVRAALALPAAQQKRLIAERRKALAAKAAAKGR